jgi:hypothetical protein
MTSRDFVYWLQGFFEVSKPLSLSNEQIEVIKNHLNLVFKHEIDPSIDKGSSEKREELTHVHSGGGNLSGTMIRC